MDCGVPDAERAVLRRIAARDTRLLALQPCQRRMVAPNQQALAVCHTPKSPRYEIASLLQRSQLQLWHTMVPPRPVQWLLGGYRA